ncbi:MAG: 1-acyl-sn-glycerol-3-phosphate acyltransferase [Bacteroidaceae bacterium]|nr:1-acyl-sn-glycerol-3-phosphate acyltransferase [Bacteroidaceae bacterium]
MNSEFDDIRPYAPEELPQVFDELLADATFLQVVQQVMPQLTPAVLRMQLQQCHTNLDVQKMFFYPLVQHIIQTCTKGLDLQLPEGFDRQQPHTFITNHRDIVLDSAFLSYLLVANGFPTTVEIAIGDNLLIYPWIKKLVRINKSFIVQRSLPPRQAFAASMVMSRYMHHAIGQKHENIWIAQREGRAKDSNDRTQDAILKMMAMGGEGTVLQRLKALHIVPMALSYEFDPCDYLKAKEFQQKRDVEGFKKSQKDDLQNMQTGIFGTKGRIHFAAAPCIDPWLDTLDPAMPKTELFPMVAQHIDHEIHRNYRLYPGNYVAADLLQGCDARAHAGHYTAADAEAFGSYIDSRLALIDLPNADEAFLRERILTMYANPVFNHEAALAL